MTILVQDDHDPTTAEKSHVSWVSALFSGRAFLWISTSRKFSIRISVSLSKLLPQQKPRRL
jgi:hypothetical protein